MCKNKHFKTFILSCLCLSLSICGCQTDPSSGPVEDVSAKAVNASFDALTREIFTNYASHDTLSLNYTLKEPSAYGIESDEVTWGDVPITQEDYEAYKTDTKDYLSRLNSLSRLNGERALTYDVLKYYLELELDGYDFVYFTTNFAPMLGIQSQLPITLAEYHFDDIQDVDNYLELLETVDDYISDLLEFEDIKAEEGFGMCRSALEASIEDCQAFCESIDSNMLIEVFPSRLEHLELSENQKNIYIQANRKAVFDHVLPAYEEMIASLSAQLNTAPEDGSLAAYKNGQDYYKYMLKSSVGTDKTPEELISLTEGNLNSSIMGLSLIMMNNPSIYDEALSAQYALEDPTEILEHFKSTLTAEQFPEAPDAKYTLKNVHPSMADSLSPAMYFIPRVDDIANNQIYLNIGGNNSGNELMPTMAHEGYPGHMYQMTYYYNTNPDPIRTVYECDGYAEGWASYVESLAYDYCGFSEDVADFYRISNLTMALNLYCRLDLGIHYENWSLEETAEFITMYLALDKATIQEVYEAILYNPTNYLIYGIGMEEIFELRENMEKNLGQDFDIKDFHKQLLDIGPAPFSIIEKYMPDAAEPVEESTENAA